MNDRHTRQRRRWVTYVGLRTHTQPVHNHACGALWLRAPGGESCQLRRLNSRVASATMFSGVKPNFF
jgi:hypothetical protein